MGEVIPSSARLLIRNLCPSCALSCSHFNQVFHHQIIDLQLATNMDLRRLLSRARLGSNTTRSAISICDIRQER